ncbi:MAG: 50S ribosomal protein L6 [Chloroflexota bacterium]
MSRIGRAPIAISKGVKVTVDAGVVTVQGPRGALSHSLNPGISVGVEDSRVVVTRESDQREHRALHGLTRSLIANMVAGVTQEFQKSLELVGIGYRAQASDTGLTLQLGLSHPVVVKPMEGVTLTVEGVNRIHVRGIDKQRVGEMAAQIRHARPPNVYTGKGVRYLGEQVRLKPGKTAGRAR